MARRSPEHLIQVQLIERVRLELVPLFPILKGPNFEETGTLRLVAFPNGGLRHIREAVKIQMEGGQPGVPDLVLPIPRGGYFGAWLELKAPAGRLGKDQVDWLEFLDSQGYRVAVRWNVEDAFQFLLDYLSAPAVPVLGSAVVAP